MSLGSMTSVTHGLVGKGQGAWANLGPCLDGGQPYDGTGRFGRASDLPPGPGCSQTAPLTHWGRGRVVAAIQGCLSD